MNLTSEFCNVGLVLRCFIKQLAILHFETYSYLSDTNYAEYFPYELPYSNTLKTEKRQRCQEQWKGRQKSKLWQK